MLDSTISCCRIASQTENKQKVNTSVNTCIKFHLMKKKRLNEDKEKKTAIDMFIAWKKSLCC